ncbi:hypothetical protein [Liquorilactobacillus capillatus]|uniref:Uncharacterized protein n=1 Tax=Liquorilactobacillus capillatus DSM 19910 TaxID=1423731 RepID=A0A0R1M4A9_9LACO|nr:hypothetical protein [Liquorilactobacillus capillatus]KRL02609.1 hypothetical protein FC81_GL000646 [Liquorilactobacillus capillatus DSM 19910]
MQPKIDVLDTAKIKEIIELGEYDNDAAIQADSTLLILDCQKYNLKNIKSIIFDRNKGICLSNMETKRLINRFVVQDIVTFGFIRATMELENIKGVLFYVYGETMMIPLTGATQHSTSWFFVNNVASYSFNSAGNKIILYCPQVFDRALKIAVETNKAYCMRVINAAEKVSDRESKLALKMVADHYPRHPQAKAFHALDKKRAISRYCVSLSEKYHKQLIKYTIQALEMEPMPEIVNETYAKVRNRMSKLM